MNELAKIIAIQKSSVCIYSTPGLGDAGCTYAKYTIPRLSNAKRMKMMSSVTSLLSNWTIFVSYKSARISYLKSGKVSLPIDALRNLRPSHVDWTAPKKRGSSPGSLQEERGH
jgi:hypothetical protein